MKKSRKTTENAPTRVTQKQQVFCELRNAGPSVKTAAAGAGYALPPGNAYPYRLDVKRRAGLLGTLVPAAKRTLKQILTPSRSSRPCPHCGGAVPTPVHAKDSDRIAAAKLVLDREAPAPSVVEGRHLIGMAALSPERCEQLYRAIIESQAQRARLSPPCPESME